MSIQKEIGKKYEKEIAIFLYNSVWELLQKKDRTAKQNEEMLNAAHASFYHWSNVGTEIHMQRGEWLISHVYAVIDRPRASLHHANNCLELTKENNIDGCDLAYAYEAMSRAFACDGNKEKFEQYYKMALELGKEIKDEEKKRVFLNDFKSEPWYEMSIR